MQIFTSNKEKRYWVYVLCVILALFASLVFGKPLQKLFQNQDVQAVIFLLGMFLMAATIAIHGLATKATVSEYVIWIGLCAIYLMLFLRLGLSERSHMIEYSVLSVFIFKAFQERYSKRSQLVKSSLYAILIAILIGVLDECIQLFIPDRVFDPIDIFFNALMVILAIASSLVLMYLKKVFRKKEH